MKNLRKFTALFAICAALFFAFASCSNSAGGGGTNPTPIQLPTPVPVAATYTVTFNANDGSENPATVTQAFTENRAESLKSFSEMGFSKSGFYFAGWGTSADATESAYADEAEYTANADITLYALWSTIPVYSVNISSEHGMVTLSQATGIEGTEITLSNTPAIGWQFDSYTVTAEDGTTIVVDNDKFTLPAQNVTVTANYTIIDYAISVNSVSNGTVTVSFTANYDEVVTITATPESDFYRFNSFVVIAADGTSIAVNGTGNTRTFVMPAQSVTVSPTFDSKHTITLPALIEGGTLTSNVTSAFEGDTVTLTVTPSTKYYVLNSVSAITSNTNISVSGDGNVKTFIMPGQNVSVNASLNLTFVPTSYNKVDTKTINGVDYDIVEFGDWPQTILPKDSTITIDESKSVVQGDFTYCLGSDGNLYAKVEIPSLTRIEKDLYFSDWSAVQSGESRWFKVEPITWRVLTTSFDHDGKEDTTGKKLLLAEYAIFGDSYAYYKTSGNENDYPTSYARGWLNSVHCYSTDTYIGFLNTAFDSIGVSKIAYTTVDNSARSTKTDAKFWNNEENQWASSPTVDKIFLLSVQEVTRGEYGFNIRTDDDDVRIHKATDYARTSGNYCTTWFLRSPDDYLGSDITLVNAKGGFACTRYANVRGFVPALCLE